MNELGKNIEFDKILTAVQELETIIIHLVEERDHLLYHEIPIIKAEYMMKLGKIEYAIFEYQSKILRTKRKIEIIQAFINRDQSYNINEIEKQLDEEYKEYTEKLLAQQREIEEARLIKDSSKSLSMDDSVELKRLYLFIVRRLHPDINPNTTEEQHAQFNDAVNAYKNGDLSELRIIYLLVEKSTFAEQVNSMEKLQEKRGSLTREREYLSNEIQKLKDSFPLNNKKLLSNKELLQEKIDELSDRLTEYQEYYNQINQHLEALINE